MTFRYPVGCFLRYVALSTNDDVTGTDTGLVRIRGPLSEIPLKTLSPYANSSRWYLRNHSQSSTSTLKTYATRRSQI